MTFNLKRLQEVARPETAREQEEARYREENRDWLEKSALIALYLERVLRVKGISKKELAQMIDVTPAQVTKLLSGKENLGLKTIAKIEKALGQTIVNIPTDVRPYQFAVPVVKLTTVSTLPFKTAKEVVGSRKIFGGYSRMPKRVKNFQIAVS